MDVKQCIAGLGFELPDETKITETESGFLFQLPDSYNENILQKIKDSMDQRAKAIEELNKAANNLAVSNETEPAAGSKPLRGAVVSNEPIVSNEKNTILMKLLELFKTIILKIRHLYV